MPELRSSLALALSSVLLLYAPARADSGLLPADLPGLIAGEIPSIPAAERLIPFMHSRSDMRLIGEDDTRHLTFYLSPEAVSAGGRLRLVYTNAVSVMPDGASLGVSINGRPAGDIPIRSPQGQLATEIPLPNDALVPGWNTVRVRAQQQHRVDCSIEAAYELWTQLDPVTSGFVSSASGDDRDLAAMLSAGRIASGETEIRVIASAEGAEGAARESLEAVQSIALLLGRKDLRIVFAETEGTGPGIDLFVGERGSANLSPAARQVIAAAPSGLSVEARQGGRVRVVLRGAGEAALSAALARAFNGPLQPVLAGRRTLTPKPSIDAGIPGRVLLSEVGYETQPFSGRLFRSSFDLVMPEDFYPGNYGSLDLKLSAATAPGLAPGAQILVRVNDRAVTSHMLYNPEGLTLTEKHLPLSLRAFHPGLNKVEILAELPNESDVACDPAARAPKPRFLMLQETALDIPDLARVGRLPDLAALAGRAYPFSRDESFDLVVDQATPARLSAAVTMLTRLSLAAGRPLSAALVVGDTPDGPASSRNALVIRAGGPRLASAVPVGKSPRLGGTELDGLVTASVHAAATPAVSASSDSQALLDAFQVQTALEQDRLSLTSRLSLATQRFTSVINRWLQYQDEGDAPRSIRAADVLVTLDQRGDDTAAGIRTTITAESEADLQKGMAVLMEPATWGALKGGTATVLRSDLSVVTQAPAAFAFYPLTDLSVGNLRRLAAAWLSDHFIVYVGLILLLICGFGLGLGYIVPRKGVRTVE